MIIRINYYLQTLIIGLAAFIVVAWRMTGKDYILFLLYLQMLAGPVQLLAALLMLMNRQTRTRELKTYWVLAVIYGILALLLIETEAFKDDRIIIGVFLLVIPWLLAGLFWYVSYRGFKKQRRG